MAGALGQNPWQQPYSPMCPIRPKRERMDDRDASAPASSAGTGWWCDLELSTDLSRQYEVDLTMTRDYGASAAGSSPTAVISTFVDVMAAVSAQMALEIAALHAAIVRCSGSRSRRSSASRGSGESIKRSASITFARASSRVCP